MHHKHSILRTMGATKIAQGAARAEERIGIWTSCRSGLGCPVRCTLVRYQTGSGTSENSVRSPTTEMASRLRYPISAIPAWWAVEAARRLTRLSSAQRQSHKASGLTSCSVPGKRAAGKAISTVLLWASQARKLFCCVKADTRISGETLKGRHDSCRPLYRGS